MAIVDVKLNGLKTKLKEGMMLCYPSHGPGRVLSIEKQECLGKEIVFCNIGFEKEDLKISVPLDKMNELGVRNVMNKERAEWILQNILNKRAKNAKGIWTKRIQEYETKINLGDAIMIAEVVRDLFASMKDPNKSYGERLIYDKAFNIFLLEFKEAMNCSIEEANRMILDVLNSNYKSSKSEIIIDKSQENNKEFDDFDDNDDLDDYENDSFDDKKTA